MGKYPFDLKPGDKLLVISTNKAESSGGSYNASDYVKLGDVVVFSDYCSCSKNSKYPTCMKNPEINIRIKNMSASSVFALGYYLRRSNVIGPKDNNDYANFLYIKD